ncbi:tetratricopeptide repeat protein [Peptostreptococcus faecalis]|uniref:tetratricopeptide repeat protein n=1 Tax=Peptostreptococcus faecalis TaxID=2045015 RepID=UPI000C7A8462|nr:hypothetical protein [Peptostreptococcus faecalis]
MNKKIISIVVLSLTLMLTGCGFTESGELMSGARKFIENEEYDKAMTNLSKVLSEDESNSEARGMYYQSMKLQKAQKCRNRQDYEQEIKELQDLINDNSGSAKVKSQAEELLKKAQDNLQRQKKATITRKENAKKTAEENKGKYSSSSTYGRSYNYNNYNNKYNNTKDDEDDEKEIDKNTGINSGNSGTSTNKVPNGTTNQNNQTQNQGTSNQGTGTGTTQKNGDSQSNQKNN